MDADPLRELIGKPLSKVKANRKGVSLVFDKDDAAIEVLVSSKAEVSGGREAAAFPSRQFTRQLKELRGSSVSQALHIVGQALEITFDRDEKLRISLRPGDFEGNEAARIAVPGRAHASYHDSGVTTLTL